MVDGRDNDLDNKGQMTSQVLSHSMSPEDPANPMNWGLHRKLYASAVAWTFAATV